MFRAERSRDESGRDSGHSAMFYTNGTPKLAPDLFLGQPAGPAAELHRTALAAKLRPLSRVLGACSRAQVSRGRLAGQNSPMADVDRTVSLEYRQDSADIAPFCPPSPDRTTAMPDRYAVMGHPIAHSKSPFIHRRFAADTGEPVAYDALLVELGGFRDAVERFRAEGGRGLNVTIPFKEEAFALSGRRSDRAARAGAVNTLWFDGTGVCGDNTDGVGLVRDLRRNLAVGIEGRSVLLLGAGGAARGVIGPLLDERPQRLVIANRTTSRAVALAGRFAGQGRVDAVALDALPAGGFDLVVNATAASLAGDLPPLPRGTLRPGGVAYDTAYAARPTPFVEWGAGEGASVATDGVGMLVEQAAESFRLWRGREPRTGPVIEALRTHLAG